MQSTDRFQVGALEEKDRNNSNWKLNQIKHTQKKIKKQIKYEKKGLDKMLCNEIQGQDR